MLLRERDITNYMGAFPQPSIDNLKYVGEWMKVNKEAVYGTQATPFSYLPFGRATLKGQKLYLRVICNKIRLSDSLHIIFPFI